MKIERHRVEAWVSELGKLEVTIPPRTSEVDIEAFLADHPEQRAHFEELAREAAGLRRHAEFVIGEIYAHFLTGSPSRWGLIVNLRALANDLEDDEHAPREVAGVRDERRPPGDEELAEAIDELVGDDTEAGGPAFENGKRVFALFESIEAEPLRPDPATLDPVPEWVIEPHHYVAEELTFEHRVMLLDGDRWLDIHGNLVSAWGIPEDYGRALLVFLFDAGYVRRWRELRGGTEEEPELVKALRRSLERYEQERES